MRILARLQEMAASEVLDLVPSSTYARIREADPHPVFRAYVIGHEGEAQGNIIGEGRIVAQWFKNAVRKLYEVLKAGINIFHDHQLDNSHEGRTPIGELVGKALKEVGGKLSTLAVVYVKPEYRALPLDVASIEADVELQKGAKGVYQVDVSEVTGIALGNSAVNRPGFAGATLLAQVQAFAKGKKLKEGDNMPDFTVEDVKAFLREQKTKPSEVYSLEELGEDSAVKGLIKEESRHATASEFGRRKRDEETFAADKAKLEKALGEKDVLLMAKDKEIAKFRVGPLIEKLAKERKLDAKQVKFIKAREGRFEPKEIDKIETELNTHLDAEIDEYRKTAEIFGLADTGDVAAGAGAGKGQGAGETGAGADDSVTVGGDEDKYLRPETNPLIPQI